MGHYIKSSGDEYVKLATQTYLNCNVVSQCEGRFLLKLVDSFIIVKKKKKCFTAKFMLRYLTSFILALYHLFLLNSLIQHCFLAYMFSFLFRYIEEAS